VDQELLDIYSDYLIAQNQYATAVGLSDLLEGRISHDRVQQFPLEKLQSSDLQTNMH
jgi:hypothetical protein